MPGFTDAAVVETGTPSNCWKQRLSTSAALMLSFLFLISGVWKLLDLQATAERMVQMLVPVSLSFAAALAVSASETLAAGLLLFPRCRRLGGWLSVLLLLAFMIYIAAFYNRLAGDECNCFPWVQRVVGPVFFIGDAAMLGLAAMAVRWSPAIAPDWRMITRLATVVGISACISCGVALVAKPTLEGPEFVMVDGQAENIRTGNRLIYFFDPESSDCVTVATEMGRWKWRDTRVIAVPTAQPQFAAAFLGDARLSAAVSSDAVKLREMFRFTDPPYAVALRDGVVVGTFNSGQLECERYPEALRSYGLIE